MKVFSVEVRKAGVDTAFTWPGDLDDLRTEIGQNADGGRPCASLTEIEDFDVRKWAPVVCYLCVSH